MNNNNNYRGAPRGRGHPGGNRRAARDAQRAYVHYNDRQQAQNWAYEPEPYDQARENRTRQPTQRSQAFRGRGGANKKQPQKKEEEQTVVPKTVDEGARDEPLYDIGPHSSLIPDFDVYSQNFEFSGFIPLLNETYEKMRGIDPRLHDRLPLSMFSHAMITHLNLEVLEVARKSGQNVLNLRTDAREILPDYQVLPQSIIDYISHVTDVVTQDGKEIRLNLPNIAIPQAPIIQDNVEVMPSGSFGPLNAQTHNAYECYISPLVSSNRVIASQQEAENYEPIPQDQIAGNLVPNRNMLGFEPIDIQTAGARSRLAGIQFEDNGTLEGRYRYSNLLHTRVYVVLAEMKDRFKMVEIKRESNEQGLNILDKIKKKITSGNLLFVESQGPINDGQVPLTERTVDIHSFGAQGSSVANQANIECMHRRRIVHGANMARGFCCLTAAGQAPGGWAATCNNNFNMADIFAPVMHVEYPHLRESRFTSRGPAGNRLNAISNFIERNYYVKK